MGEPLPATVVAAVLVDDLRRPTRLLAARRTAPAALAGRWEFPGGKVEPGEGLEAALHREIREELGVAVTLGELVCGPEGPWWPLRPGWVMALWWAVTTPDHGHGGLPEPEPLQDHDQLRWLTAATIDEVPWLESNTAIVAHIAGRLGEN